MDTLLVLYTHFACTLSSKMLSSPSFCFLSFPSLLFHFLSSSPGYHWSTTPTPFSTVSPVGGCREKEFQCDNGRCVPAGPLGVVCDGVNNCGDGSDEKYCGEPSILTHLCFICSQLKGVSYTLFT